MTLPSPARRRALGAAAGLVLAATMPIHATPAAASLNERRIPKSGESLPIVGLGTWQTFDVAGEASALAQAREALARFAELGGRVVDSSPMYGSSEQVVGDLAADLGIAKQLFLATKVWTSGRAEGIRQMEASMRKLRVERLDLMQVHNLVDARTHFDTLRGWKREGRIRYLGVTHYHAGAHDEVERFVRPGDLDFVQINYSLGEREADRRLLSVAADTGTAVLVNRPFQEGALFRRVQGKPLPDWAGALGIASWGQFFLKWILGHPAVTCAIPGTRNARHVADNLGAATGALPNASERARMAQYFDRI